MFVGFDALHTSQKNFNHVTMLPGLNQYLREEKVSRWRTQHSATAEAQTNNSWISSWALYHWATALSSLFQSSKAKVTIFLKIRFHHVKENGVDPDQLKPADLDKHCVKQQHIDVNATSWRHININMTLFWRHVPAGKA